MDATTSDDNKFGLLFSITLFILMRLLPASDDDDEVLLYVAVELPILTTVLSLFDFWVRRMGVLLGGGIIQVTKIAIRARIAPNRNGGPGSICF